MPSSTKMVKIKIILKIIEDNINLDDRQIDKSVGCSKNTNKAIKTRAKELNFIYDTIKVMDEKSS